MTPVTLEATISAPAYGTAATNDAIWATTPHGVSRIDPATNQVVARIALGAGNDEIDGITATKAAVWVADYDTSTVYRIDPKTGAVNASIKVGDQPEGIVANDDGVWVSNHHGGSVSRIDPATNQVVATVSVSPTGEDGPYGIALGFGNVWVGSGNISAVVRIDAKTNQVLATIPVVSPLYPGGLAATSDAIWVSGAHVSTSVIRIDPKTNSVAATIDVGGYNGSPFAVADAPWFPVYGTQQLGGIVRINPATNQIDQSLGLLPGFAGGGTSFADGSVWIVDESGNRPIPAGSNTIARIPLTALSSQ
jgi:YVTN family beta-propeller protein